MKKIALLFFIVCNLHAQEWVNIEPQFNPPGEYSLYHAAMGDENNLWFVDYESGRIFHTSDGGYNWIMQHDSIVPIPEYWDIFFVNSQTGWVLASTDSSTFILKTTDVGENWEKIETPYFHKIYFQNENNGTAAGPPGIYQTNDGGLTWQKAVYNEEEIPNGIEWVEQIVFVNDQKRLIILQPGNNFEGWCIIMESDDCGLSWSKKTLNIGLVLPINIFAVDSLKIYMVNHFGFFTSTDGGYNWTFKPGVAIRSIYFADAYNGWGVGGFSSPGTSNSGIFQTTDAGNGWEKKEACSHDWIKLCFKKNINKLYILGFIEKIYIADISTGKKEENNFPTDFMLYQNYPNPFNPSTLIRFDIDKPDYYTLKLYDLLGKEVCCLLNSNLVPNTYELSVDGNNLASGIYFVVIRNSISSKAIKIMLQK